MFTKTNLQQEDWKNVRHAMTSQFTEDNEVGSFYHMDAPFRLCSICVDHMSEDEYFIMDTLSPDLSFYISIGKNEAVEHITTGLHQHDFYELLYVVSGTVYQNIENQRHLYPEGSFCLLNKKTRHTEEYSTDYKVAFLQLSEGFLREICRDLSMQFFKVEKEKTHTKLDDFLSQNLSSSPRGKEFIDFIPLDDAGERIGESYAILKKLHSELSEPKAGSSVEIKYLCTHLLSLLNDRTLYHTKPVTIGTEMENSLYNEIVRMMEQTDGRVTRAELEEKLHYSGTYLNRIIKKYTGHSIFDYGMTFCMKRAATLLVQTDMSIAEIAAGLQFGNRSNFYKQFTQMYNMTPAKYRASHGRKQG